MGGFRFLEHMSDAFIEAWGDSFEEAYVEAAKAFYELVSSMSGVEARVERVVEAEGRDLQELLYDMLEKPKAPHPPKRRLVERFKAVGQP